MTMAFFAAIRFALLILLLSTPVFAQNFGVTAASHGHHLQLDYEGDTN